MAADLPTLFDAEDGRPRRLEQAIETLRERHGEAAVLRGPAASEAEKFSSFRRPQAGFGNASISSSLAWIA